MREDIFNNCTLTDEETLSVIEQSIGEINFHARINGVLDEDLKQDMIIEIYKQLTSGRRKNKKN